MLKIGGIHWDPHLIGWGQIGRPQKGTASRKELLGYWNRKKNGKKGKMSNEEKQKQTANFWKAKTVYALFEKGSPSTSGKGFSAIVSRVI